MLAALNTTVVGDPATANHPFSARYAYHPNGTIWQAEFYNAGSPADKRYGYVFGTTSYDALEPPPERGSAVKVANWTERPPPSPAGPPLEEATPSSPLNPLIIPAIGAGSSQY